MKLIVAGGREFTNYSHLSECIEVNFDLLDLEIVSGCARGADALGIKFAEENDIPLTKFPADWDRHGKSAGYIRNAEMADYADSLLAFWDGRSRGTKHMIDLARKKGLGVNIVRY